MYGIMIQSTPRLTDSQRRAIESALGNLFKGWHEVENRQVYVPFGYVDKAVAILNQLGFVTDEDEE